jgi:hypothetical protein
VNKGQERLAPLLVTGRNSTKVFHFVEEALNFLTQLVWLSVIEHRRLAMLPGWDDRSHLLSPEMLANLLTVIPLVHDHILQLGECRALGKDDRKNWRIMAGTAG